MELRIPASLYVSEVRWNQIKWSKWQTQPKIIYLKWKYIQLSTFCYYYCCSILLVDSIAHAVCVCTFSIFATKKLISKIESNWMGCILKMMWSSPEMCKQKLHILQSRFCCWCWSLWLLRPKCDDDGVADDVSCSVMAWLMGGIWR